MKLVSRPSAVAILALAGLLAGCSKSDTAKNPGSGADKPRPVKTARVEHRAMERLVIVTGSLLAQDYATLSVKVPGRLQTMAVDLGSVVRQGDVIAQVEPRDYELRLQQAEAALAQARATVGLPLEGTDDRIDPDKTSQVKQARALLEEASKNRDRAVNLDKDRLIAKSELDTAEAAYSVALNRYGTATEEARTRLAMLAQRRAEAESARKQLADATLHAPFDGTIQEKRANLGEFLAAGTPVATLVRTDPLRLRLEVPERHALQVHTGQITRLVVTGDSTVHTGVIKRLSPMLSEQNRMLIVEADVPNNGRLRPGLFARAEIVTREEDKPLTAPLAALVTFAGLEKMFVVQEGKAVEKSVGTGRRTLTWVELVSGTKAGDEVILEPGNLRTGQPVTVLPPEPSSTEDAPSNSE